MVTSFNTSAAPATGGNGKGGNVLAWVIGLGVLGYLAYRFIIKPAQEEKAQAQAQPPAQ